MDSMPSTMTPRRSAGGSAASLAPLPHRPKRREDPFPLEAGSAAVPSPPAPAAGAPSAAASPSSPRRSRSAAALTAPTAAAASFSALAALAGSADLAGSGFLAGSADGSRTLASSALAGAAAGLASPSARGGSTTTTAAGASSSVASAVSPASWRFRSASLRALLSVMPTGPVPATCQARVFARNTNRNTRSPGTYALITRPAATERTSRQADGDADTGAPMSTTLSTTAAAGSAALGLPPNLAWRLLRRRCSSAQASKTTLAPMLYPRRVTGR
mmetsp:Transcript_19196/g.73463  ORF Transcript_19196/g.73463 Transcript_19196/m.73463 type:complete len:274 (+) Transcript_19196:1511-2332(+)